MRTVSRARIMGAFVSGLTREVSAGATKARSTTVGRSTWARWSGLVLLLGAVASVLLIPQLARGKPSSEYSFDSTGCAHSSVRDLSDPVGAYFKGDSAGFSNTALQTSRHANWNIGGGGKQGLRVYNTASAYVCHETDEARANAVYSRHHVRLWRTRPPSAGDVRTVGTPHYEEYTDCGHAVVEYSGTSVSGFDLGRRVLRESFRRAGHKVDNVYWGNTKRMPQCNGRRTSSNGTVAVIRINHYHRG